MTFIAYKSIVPLTLENIYNLKISEIKLAPKLTVLKEVSLMPVTGNKDISKDL